MMTLSYWIFTCFYNYSFSSFYDAFTMIASQYPYHDRICAYKVLFNHSLSSQTTINLIIQKIQSQNYKTNCQNQKQLYQQSYLSMADSQFQSIRIDLDANQNLKTYLTQNKIQYPTDNVQRFILRLLCEKDQIIKAMQGQITKYKAQQVRNNKIITQLQEKISQICPNNNNTGSSFMMASQFKDYFEDFMKNCLPTCLSPLINHPQAYCQYSSVIFSSVYESMNNLITDKLDKVCEILNINKSHENRHKIKNSLLKIMQDDWETIIGNKIKENNQQNNQDQLKWTTNFIKNALNYQNQQIIEIIESQEFRQMDKKLIKICGYMILQERKWEFLLPKSNQKKIQKYNKKDYVCIDGWIKEKEDVLVILQGLVRETEEGTVTKHPNLRNYVIPFRTDSQQELKLILRQSNEIQLKNVDNLDQQQNQKAETFDKSCQYSILLQQNKVFRIKQREQEDEMQQQNLIGSGKLKRKLETGSFSNKKLKSKSTFFAKKLKQKQNNKENQQLVQNEQKYKQKIQTAIRKLSKIQQKLSQNYMDTDSVSVMFSSNVNGINLDQLKQKQPNLTMKLHNIQNICDNNSNGSLCIVKSSKIQKNSGKNGHNLISDPSFQQILTLPQRKKQSVDQLPLKRQSSRTKKSSSRKTSAGKIIVQCIQSKQNIQNKNNREHTRQKQNNTKQGVYRDMIKQKLGTDIRPEKQKQKQKGKQNKNKYRDQDRPLRIMHFKKIRQKYLNL